MRKNYKYIKIIKWGKRNSEYNGYNYDNNNQLRRWYKRTIVPQHHSTTVTCIHTPRGFVPTTIKIKWIELGMNTRRCVSYRFQPKHAFTEFHFILIHFNPFQISISISRGNNANVVDGSICRLNIYGYGRKYIRQTLAKVMHILLYWYEVQCQCQVEWCI